MNATIIPPRIICVLTSQLKKEKLMFATFTDWTLDEPKTFAESAQELWPSMKEAGAVNMRIVQTSDKGVS